MMTIKMIPVKESLPSWKIWMIPNMRQKSFKFTHRGNIKSMGRSTIWKSSWFSNPSGALCVNKPWSLTLSRVWPVKRINFSVRSILCKFPIWTSVRSSMNSLWKTSISKIWFIIAEKWTQSLLLLTISSTRDLWPLLLAKNTSCTL